MEQLELPGLARPEVVDLLTFVLRLPVSPHFLHYFRYRVNGRPRFSLFSQLKPAHVDLRIPLHYFICLHKRGVSCSFDGFGLEESAQLEKSLPVRGLPRGILGLAVGLGRVFGTLFR